MCPLGLPLINNSASFLSLLTTEVATGLTQTSLCRSVSNLLFSLLLLSLHPVNSRNLGVGAIISLCVLFYQVCQIFSSMRCSESSSSQGQKPLHGSWYFFLSNPLSLVGEKIFHDFSLVHLSWNAPSLDILNAHLAKNHTQYENKNLEHDQGGRITTDRKQISHTQAKPRIQHPKNNLVQRNKSEHESRIRP